MTSFQHECDVTDYILDYGFSYTIGSLEDKDHTPTDGIQDFRYM